MYYCIWDYGTGRDSYSHRCHQIIADKSVYNDGSQFIYNHIEGNEYSDWNTRYRAKNFSRISYREAEEFKNRFTEAAWVSISFYASSLATVKYGSEETNPNVSLQGVDENLLTVSGYEIESGRNFSRDEVQETGILC